MMTGTSYRIAAVGLLAIGIVPSLFALGCEWIAGLDNRELRPSDLGDATIDGAGDSTTGSLQHDSSSDDGSHIPGRLPLVQCDAGVADCDHDASNKCEVALSSDKINCGACGHACTTNLSDDAGGKALCVRGTCAIDCSGTGFGDCDGVPWTGCESNLRDDPRHCGKCSFPCDSGVCEAGQCR